MDDSFILTVPFKGQAYELTTKFTRFGYIYQFHILWEGQTLIFERDEDYNYRAINALGSQEKIIDKELLHAIGEKLVKAFA